MIVKDNERVLLLTDIHLNTAKADKIIKWEAPDKVVLMGDYFHEFDDTVDQNLKAAIWLKNKLWDPNYTVLLGNHDCSHNPYNKTAPCSGWTWDKHDAVNSILTWEDWRRFHFFTFVNEYLITHAGLHSFYLPSSRISVEKFLLSESRKAFKALGVRDQDHWFWAAGRARYGPARYGGLVWRDADRENSPISGLRQIFGHTPQRVEDPKDLWKDKENLCIDTRLRYYVIFHGKNLEIKCADDIISV